MKHLREALFHLSANAGLKASPATAIIVAER
jgi:hypothetical protein